MKSVCSVDYKPCGWWQESFNGDNWIKWTHLRSTELHSGYKNAPYPLELLSVNFVINTRCVMTQKSAVLISHVILPFRPKSNIRTTLFWMWSRVSRRLVPGDSGQPRILVFTRKNTHFFFGNFNPWNETTTFLFETSGIKQWGSSTSRKTGYLYCWAVDVLQNVLHCCM